MFESDVGLATPATRQKPGRPEIGVAPFPGGVNVPPATGCAVVIVVFGSCKPLRLSQEVHAAAGSGLRAVVARSAPAAIPGSDGRRADLAPSFGSPDDCSCRTLIATRSSISLIMELFGPAADAHWATSLEAVSTNTHGCDLEWPLR